MVAANTPICENFVALIVLSHLFVKKNDVVLFVLSPLATLQATKLIITLEKKELFFLQFFSQNI